MKQQPPTESAVVQDDNGTDLWLLRQNLERSAEERLLNLEAQLEFAAELRRAAK
jgi:hypothetical protein